MAIHGNQWGFLVRTLYKMFRPTLEKVVADSTNKADDTILEVADALAGVKPEVLAAFRAKF